MKRVVYVSPLKALSNDIHKIFNGRSARSHNSREKRFADAAHSVAVRTGDTPMYERQQMVKTPPHILVTTPESLFILLTAGKSRELLKTTQTLILDEIHAVVDDKRGAPCSVRRPTRRACKQGR
jgi:ATP-dependent Lhr-like helicase